MGQEWAEKEQAGIDLGDARLNKRSVTLLDRLPDESKRSIFPTSGLSIALADASRIATTLYDDRRCPVMSDQQRRHKCQRDRIMMPTVDSPGAAGRSGTAAGP